MKRQEIINLLEAWKLDSNLFDQSRDYTIVEFHEHEGLREHVIIRVNRKYHSFDFSINQNEDVIIEDYETPVLSGIMDSITMRGYLENL